MGRCMYQIYINRGEGREKKYERSLIAVGTRSEVKVLKEGGGRWWWGDRPCILWI